MFGSVIFFVACLAAATVPLLNAAEPNECMKLTDPGKHKCCMKYSESANKHTAKINEINQKCTPLKSEDPSSCDYDICIAKTAGYGSDDGILNKNAALEEFKKNLKDQPELLEKLKNNCLNGDLSKFSLPENCDLKKYRLCLDAHKFLACEEWTNDDDCKDTMSLFERCF